MEGIAAEGEKVEVVHHEIRHVPEVTVNSFTPF